MWKTISRNKMGYQWLTGESYWKHKHKSLVSELSFL